MKKKKDPQDPGFIKSFLSLPFYKPKYSTSPFPRMRNFVLDAGWVGRKYTLINIPFEVDVTDARKLIKDYAKKYGESLSFTTFILLCYVKAMDENRLFHLLRRGRKLINYDSIDLCVIIEKEVQGALQPIHYIIRDSDKKSFMEIQEEVRTADRLPFEEMYPKHSYQFFNNYPKFFRRISLALMKWFPILKKRYQGTACITSMGMMGSGVAYTIPVIMMTSSLSVGCIDTKPVIINGKIKDREILHVVLSLDHDIVDASPGMRFISRLKELIEGCYGLPVENNKVKNRAQKNFVSV